MKKENYALIIGILIGLIMGITSTYVLMSNERKSDKTKYEEEKLSITEKLNLEIKKLGFKNRTYKYVDLIESAILEYNTKNEKEPIKESMFALNNKGEFYEINEETNEPLENGKTFKVEFLEFPPLEHTVLVITDKAIIEEAIFLVEENFQIKYNLIGTTVTKLEDK